MTTPPLQEQINAILDKLYQHTPFAKNGYTLPQAQAAITRVIAEAERAARLSERAWAYKNMRDHGTEAAWVAVAKERYDRLAQLQGKEAA